MTWLSLVLIALSGWQGMEINNFRIWYAPGMERFARKIMAQAPKAKKALEKNLGFNFQEPITIVISSSDENFKTLQAGKVAEWASAVASPEQRTIFLKPIPRISSEDFSTIFRHELAHIFIYHRLGKQRVPLWFEEGMAVLWSGEFSFTRLEVLAQIGLSGRYLSFSELERGFPAQRELAQIAYLQSEDFTSYLIDQLGEDKFIKFLDQLSQGEDFYFALSQISGKDFSELEKDWFKRVRLRYGLSAILTGSGSLWFFITLLFLLAYLKKRKRALERKALLESEFYYSEENDEEQDDDIMEGEDKWR